MSGGEDLARIALGSGRGPVPLSAADGLARKISCLDGGSQGAQIGRSRQIGEVVFLLT